MTAEQARGTLRFVQTHVLKARLPTAMYHDLRTCLEKGQIDDAIAKSLRQFGQMMHYRARFLDPFPEPRAHGYSLEEIHAWFLTMVDMVGNAYKQGYGVKDGHLHNPRHGSF
jgi:hypothetical protein